MVFESLVTDLLNRFLGDFVDNLDSSQLNIGIWGGELKIDYVKYILLGNVKLKNLVIKSSALENFYLPVKLKFGILNNLVMKIPWKNLYTEPVLVDIEGLYLIIIPNKEMIYCEEKAQKEEFKAKQKALVQLEENRQHRRSLYFQLIKFFLEPKNPKADTFTEKLIAQIIKNLQIDVRNIHVRYEDKYSNRERPFSVGITLESLVFQVRFFSYLNKYGFRLRIRILTLKIFNN